MAMRSSRSRERLERPLRGDHEGSSEQEEVTGKDCLPLIPRTECVPWGGSMRLLTVHALLVAVFFVSSSGSAGPKSAAEHPGISRSGSEFLGECSRIDSERNRSPVRI